MNTLEKVLPEEYDYLNDNFLLELDDISYDKFKTSKLFQKFINELFNIISKYFKNKVSYEVKKTKELLKNYIKLEKKIMKYYMKKNF